MSSTIIILTPPPKRRTTVLHVDVLEDATDAELLHAALSELEAEQTQHPGPGKPTE